MRSAKYLKLLVMLRMAWCAHRRWKRFNRSNEKRVHRAAERGRKRIKAACKRAYRVARRGRKRTKAGRKRLRRVVAK